MAWMKLACAALLAAVALTTPAGAEVLLNKALSTAEFGWNSNINLTSQQAADEVVLSAGALGSQLTWYGFRHDGGTSSNFRVRVFNTGVGEPAAVPFYDQTLGLVTGTDTGLDNQFGNSIFVYSSAIPPLPLNAGFTYWLTIASTDSPIWAWSHAAIGPPGNTQFHRDGDAGAWRNLATLGFGPQTLEQAFRLEGTFIPEPASLASAGLLLSLLVRRRSTCNI